MNQEKNSISSVLFLNFIMFIFSFNAVLARYISIPTVIIACGKGIFASITVFTIIKITKGSLIIGKKSDLKILILAGVLTAVNMWTYMQSSKVGGIAIAMICNSTMPVLVAIIEPIIYHRNIKLRDILFSVLVIIAVVISVPEFSMKSNAFVGVLWGMVAATAYAILNIINKHLTQTNSGLFVSLGEQSIAAVTLIPLVIATAPTVEAWPLKDILLIIALGVISSGIGYALYINTLKKVTTQLASITGSLQIVWATLLGLILLHEVSTVREYIGAALITIVILYYQLTSNKAK